MNKQTSLYAQKDSNSDLKVWFGKDKQGNLVINGQDLGDNLEKIFSDGITEYEWSITIDEKESDLLVRVLNGKKNENVLTLFAKEFSNSKAMKIEDFLKKNNIAYEFWNRIGE